MQRKIEGLSSGRVMRKKRAWAGTPSTRGLVKMLRDGLQPRQQDDHVSQDLPEIGEDHRGSAQSKLCRNLTG